MYKESGKDANLLSFFVRDLRCLPHRRPTALHDWKKFWLLSIVEFWVLVSAFGVALSQFESATVRVRRALLVFAPCWK